MRLRGQEESIGVTTVLAAIIITAILLALMISQTGGKISDLATIHCNIVPQLCNKVVVAGDRIALESVKSLQCAVGAVGSGKISCNQEVINASVCSDIICCEHRSDTLDYRWTTKDDCLNHIPLVTEPDAIIEDNTCAQKVGNKVVSQACRNLLQNQGQKPPGATFDCESGQLADEPLLIVSDNAKQLCDEECKGDDTCKVSLGSKQSLKYSSILKQDEIFECMCHIDYAAGSNQAKNELLQGQSIQTINRLCKNLFSSVKTAVSYELGSCSVKTTELKSADVQSIKGTLNQCTCDYSLENQRFSYPVYGESSDAAYVSCTSDFNAVKQGSSASSSIIDKSIFVNTCSPVSGDFVVDKDLSSSASNAPAISPQACTATRQKVTSCVVSNFELPQEVSNFEDWIIYYGDPQYLAYWQSFPPDQDTWTAKPDFGVWLGLTLVSSLPWGKLGFAVTKGLAAKGLVAVGSKIPSTGVIGGKVASWVTKAQANQAITQNIKNALIARYTSKGGLTKLAVRGYGAKVALDAAEWADMTFDSKYNNYIPIANSIVLDAAHQARLAYDLPPELKGKPVLISWDPGLLVSERITGLQLVSPCKINTLNVEKRVAVCDEYLFDEATGVSACSKGVNFQGSDFWRNSIFGPGDASIPLCKLDSFLQTDEKMLKSMDIARRTKIGTFMESVSKNHPEIKIEELVVTLNEKKLEEEGVLEVDEGKWVPFRPKLDPDEYIGMRARFTVNGRHLIFADLEEDDGFFDSYILSQCRTDAVAVIIPSVDDGNMPHEKGARNYCVDTRGKTGQILTEYGGYAAMGLGVIIGVGTGVGLVSAPVSVPLIFGIGSASTAASSYLHYSGYWPG